VIDAPLSETAIVGGCTGAAIMGMRPVAEMQFADFVSCAWDHLITVAAKQHYRAGTAVPIVVRLPSGGGFSGGPFHSQNPESSFAHIPGLKVICPATPEDAKGLLATAIQDPNPCLYFEHKHLYRRIKAEVPDERYETPFGKARIHKEGTDLSVITWGAMVYTAQEAAQQLDSDGVSVEILDLRTLLPWDKQAVLESARKTSKVLVLHEDTHTAGFGLSRRRSRRHSSRRSKTSWQGCATWLSTRRQSGYRDRRRRRDAPDGRLRLRGDDHEVAQAGG
jgi:2-oxoisovalerate dehydrogenase E1 component beta subunit